MSPRDSWFTILAFLPVWMGAAIAAVVVGMSLHMWGCQLRDAVRAWRRGPIELPPPIPHRPVRFSEPAKKGIQKPTLADVQAEADEVRRRQQLDALMRSPKCVGILTPRHQQPFVFYRRDPMGGFVEVRRG